MNHIIDIQPPPHYLGIQDTDLYDKDVIVKKIDGERIQGKLKEINGPQLKIAGESGMTPLAENALARAREGRISISDVYRISQDA